MKNLLGILFISLLFILISCASVQQPNINYTYPQTGSSNNSSIAVKDYQTRGIIVVKSSEIIYVNGNHTGSKITFEMLMLEAQKLGADDIINLRIDVNQNDDFAFNGERIKTTYNYTGTALAIKYTTAVSIENRGINYSNTTNVLNETNKNISQSQIKRASSGISPIIQSANIRNNWLSIGATIAGGGLRYERMLNQYLSLGGHVYYQLLGLAWGDFGIDAVARVYPFGKVLYIGMGLGLHGYEEYRVGDGSNYDDDYDNNYVNATGLGICPEIGVKIHFGRQGGFFMDIGYKNPLLFSDYGFGMNTVAQINFGWAF